MAGSKGARPADVTQEIILDGPEQEQAIRRIMTFCEDEPHQALGPQTPGQTRGQVINAYLPRAVKAWIVLNGKPERHPMKRIQAQGLYQVRPAKKVKDAGYKIGFKDETGYEIERHDPYAFETMISDEDLHLFGEGNHFRIYEKLGAQIASNRGVDGVHFAVWAPNAKAVSVVGNFNHWLPGAHPMTRVHYSGVWALFVPDLDEGEVYKYAVKTAHGEILEKADPFAFRAEFRPNTASVVTNLARHSWNDADWMNKRRSWNYLESPQSVYEVHLGSWKRDDKQDYGFMSYRDLAKDLVNYVKDMGFTHIELLPVAEHPLDMSWGYQVLSYFAPSSRFGTPEDFMYFVDHCHQNGIGVILDWVPAHFPKDIHGLANFDGKEIYAYEGWKKGEHKDWGTLVFDYGRNEVKNFLISNALFWLEKYHVDGLRVDAVASMLYLDYSRKQGEWEPNIFGGRENLEAIDFLKRFNEVVHSEHPGVMTIAEESTAFPGVSRPTFLGGLGFSLKWNMGWMHDSLEYFEKDPIYRSWNQGSLTFSMIYAYTENFVLPISHDEVVHGKKSLLYKMPGDEWQQSANHRLFLAYMFTHPGKKLLFMGQEFAQGNEWNFDSSLDWHVLHYDKHRTAQALTRDLNKLYCSAPALYELDVESAGFEWIDFSDAAASIVSFLRWSKDKKDLIVVALNMTPTPRTGYRIGVPLKGFYQEILNTDAAPYGGSGLGNYGGFEAEAYSWQGRPYSLSVTLPPLAAVVFRYRFIGPGKKKTKA